MTQLVKKWAIAAGVVLAGVGLAALLMMRALREPPPAWTTASPQALEAFEQGLDSLAKLYWADAAPHFLRAVELDEDFAVAKLYLLLTDGGSGEDRESWFRDLSEIELAPLTPRERFLIGYWRARFSGEGAEAEALLDSYLQRYPDDPWAFSTRCERQWENEDWDEAEACYRRLIDLHPNWVEAQQRLGLIAMARGRFLESEEHFRTYRYIAPDQAAPWDSLGQLQMVRGQYEKAEEAFVRALEIKDDYCWALWHLAALHSITREFDASEERLRQLEQLPSCGDYQVWGMICSRRAFNAYGAGELEVAAELMDGGCLERRGGFDLIAHRLAIERQDFADARRLEETLESSLTEKRESGDVYLVYENFLRAMGKHLVGMRQWSEGHTAAGCRQLAEADETLLYWGSDRGLFKLFNLRQLAVCLQAAGDEAGAAEARADLECVNPSFFAEYAWPELPGTVL